MKLNWKPVIKSLVSELDQNGYTIDSIHNGEEQCVPYDIDVATSLIDATDESWMTISKDGVRSSLYIVLGNSPSELVADYTIPKNNKEFGKELDKLITNWSISWDGLECPLEEPRKRFDKTFKSPAEAIEYCKSNSWKQQLDNIMAVVRYNMVVGEYQFAAELVRESESIF